MNPVATAVVATDCTAATVVAAGAAVSTATAMKRSNLTSPSITDLRETVACPPTVDI